MPNRVGTTVGKYKLLELLGRGGMAEVYKARHPTLGREVTVKILHPHLAEGEGFLARFEREAKAVAAMRHPRIVQIFDYEATEDANYMVMEFIDAGTLQDRVAALAKEGRGLSVREALSILRQVAEALDYAHGRGILHRDVKPSNILLDSSGGAFLTDFGIARILSGAQFTATGVMIGTPTYMSPEQGTGEELTAASDLYSLGVIAFELLTGRVPFSAETTPLAVIHKHIHEPPPGLRAVRKDLPAAAEDAVLKALAKKPGERFKSAGEFARALEKALPEGVLKTVDGGGQKQPAPVSAQSTMAMEVEPVPSRTQMPTEVMETPPELNIQGIPDPARREGAAEAVPAEEAERPPKLGKIKTAEAKPPAPAGGVKPAAETLMASMRGILNTRRGRIAAAVVAAAIVLAAGWWILSGGISSLTCVSVESCIAQAQELRERGDLAGFITLMEAAAGRVPGDEHPPNAGIWCDIGDAERELSRMDAARESYTRCIEWTEGIPEFQDVRTRGEEALQGL
ncbi:MAG: serine/threonine protein kinase [Anaerolineales bacterium]|nr:serine/threonine protein kinase [Anaerolineales bacterium]